MLLSISSSNDRIPKSNWLAIWFCIITLLVSFFSFAEWHIRSLGWAPSVVDSVQLWVVQRKRASELGNKAIILVGASRIQMDIDMTVAKRESGLMPVQLAINGSPFLPVLENLANDPTITGVILISTNAYNISRGSPLSTPIQWIKYYQNISSQGMEPYRIIDNKIISMLNDSLSLRYQGAKLFTVLSEFAFQESSINGYLTTHPDRSMEADYGKVEMPMFYMTRLHRHFGEPLVEELTSFEDVIDVYERKILAIEPVENPDFFTDLEYLMHLIAKIELRGGKVILVRFPTGKLVWEVDKKRYPRERYWDEIEKHHAASINFSDYSLLNKFTLPDGSHLDYRDRKEFTLELMKLINDKDFL